jgi:RNA polymerase primary sigma factor
MARAKVSKPPLKQNPNAPHPSDRPGSESAPMPAETEASEVRPLEAFAPSAPELLERNGDAFITPQNVTNGHASGNGVKPQNPELTEKIKELIRLAQEQGYLTYGDINDALPENLVTPEDLDEIYIKLRNL